MVKRKQLVQLLEQLVKVKNQTFSLFFKRQSAE